MYYIIYTDTIIFCTFNSYWNSIHEYKYINTEKYVINARIIK